MVQCCVDTNIIRHEKDNIIKYNMTVEDKIQLLGFQDITTPRQKKNGTKIFKLPIKMYGRYIKVGSFKSGYVRRLECIGYRSESSYQLNKRVESEPDYYKIERNGKTLYRKFTTKTCELIPNEQDRLEYLITYCLKNYYIGHANKIARSSNEYVPKWVYDEVRKKPEVKVIINGHRYNIT